MNVAATGVVDRISVAPPVALVVGLLLLVGVAIVVVVIAMGFSCRTQADSGDPPREAWRCQDVEQASWLIDGLKKT